MEDLLKNPPPRLFISLSQRWFKARKMGKMTSSWWSDSRSHPSPPVTSSCSWVMSLRRGYTVFLSWALNSPASFFISFLPRSHPPQPVLSFLSRHFRPPRLLSSMFFFLLLSLDNTAAAAAYLSLTRSSFLSLAVFPLPPSLPSHKSFCSMDGGGGVGVVKWWVQRGHIPGSLLD